MDVVEPISNITVPDGVRAETYAEPFIDDATLALRYHANLVFSSPDSAREVIVAELNKMSADPQTVCASWVDAIGFDVCGQLQAAAGSCTLLYLFAGSSVGTPPTVVAPPVLGTPSFSVQGLSDVIFQIIGSGTDFTETSEFFPQSSVNVDD